MRSQIRRLVRERILAPTMDLKIGFRTLPSSWVVGWGHSGDRPRGRGCDRFCQALQKQEGWSGTVLRVYTRPWFGRRHSSVTRYWDVRTADGQVRSVRIWSRTLWSAASPGDGLIKREGELHPDLLPRR